MARVLRVLFGIAVLATLAEAVYALRTGRRIYRRDELVSDLTCAALGFGVLGLHRGAFLAFYAFVYEHFGLAWATQHRELHWLFGFVVYDLCYYVDHRATHTYEPLWASHRVHHQTRAFHLLTGLRMSAVGPLLGYPFRLPLALLGVDPLTYACVDLIHALCTYFLHARFVGSLGKIGWVLNTPVHHRVHHSDRPEHFGKNYGGVLLLWDHLFKTYQAPVSVETFGDGETVEPLGPWRAHIEPARAWLRGACVSKQQ